MSTLTLDEIARFTEEPERSSPAPVRKDMAPRVGTRRQFLKGAFTVGTGLALGLVGSVRLPQPALAACVGSLNSNMDPACSTANDGFGCNQACGPTVPTPDTCNANDWHKWTGSYRNRPNVCSSNAGQGGADGWFWRKCCTGQCGGRVSEYKCHDGCRLVSGVWKNSVCRTLTCTGGLC